jgi:hypothetical protein
MLLSHRFLSSQSWLVTVNFQEDSSFCGWQEQSSTNSSVNFTLSSHLISLSPAPGDILFAHYCQVVVSLQSAFLLHGEGIVDRGLNCPPDVVFTFFLSAYLTLNYLVQLYNLHLILPSPPLAAFIPILHQVRFLPFAHQYPLQDKLPPKYHQCHPNLSTRPNPNLSYFPTTSWNY